MVSGKTTLIAHLGYPTEGFKAPMVYNPWFENKGIDALVVPIGIKRDDYPNTIKALRTFTNLRGALVTMPHKVTTLDLMDEVTPTAKVAGACNAILLRPDGSLLGDMFDGAGFVRGVLRKGFTLKRKRVLVSGNGGVGSAIAASLAEAGVSEIALFDNVTTSSESLATRLNAHYSDLRLSIGSNDPAGFDLIVNATPLGMNQDDPLPFDMTKVSADTFVGEVVMSKSHHAAPSGGAGQGLPDPNGDGHAVRIHPCLPGVLRVRDRDARRTPGRVGDQVLEAGPGSLPRNSPIHEIRPRHWRRGR
jgi:shikimate dehydrogenase